MEAWWWRGVIMEWTELIGIIQNRFKKSMSAIGVVDEKVEQLKKIGRFLSWWDCTTGLPVTAPSENPFAYQTGDYFRVAKVADEGGTNYKPDGDTYTGEPSTVVETEAVKKDDIYFYDGITWTVIPTESPKFKEIGGDPMDNTALAAEFNKKLNSNQGAENEGKMLQVDENGELVLVDAPTFDVLVDNETIEKDEDGVLQVKEKGITHTQIADYTVSKVKIDPNAKVAYTDDTQTLKSKTIDITQNTLKGSSTDAGKLLKLDDDGNVVTGDIPQPDVTKAYVDAQDQSILAESKSYTNSSVQAEENRRQSADAALEAALEEEKTLRNAADNMLENSINTEVSNREAVDTALSNRIEAETEDRQRDYDSIQHALEEEINQRTLKDTELEYTKQDKLEGHFEGKNNEWIDLDDADSLEDKYDTTLGSDVYERDTYIISAAAEIEDETKYGTAQVTTISNHNGGRGYIEEIFIQSQAAASMRKWKRVGRANTLNFNGQFNTNFNQIVWSEWQELDVSSSGVSSWDDLTDKPFSTIGSGLKVQSDALKADCIADLGSTDDTKPLAASQGLALADYIDANISDTMAYVIQEDREEKAARQAGDNILDEKKLDKNEVIAFEMDSMRLETSEPYEKLDSYYLAHGYYPFIKVYRNDIQYLATKVTPSSHMFTVDLTNIDGFSNDNGTYDVNFLQIIITEDVVRLSFEDNKTYYEIVPNIGTAEATLSKIRIGDKTYSLASSEGCAFEDITGVPEDNYYLGMRFANFAKLNESNEFAFPQTIKDNVGLELSPAMTRDWTKYCLDSITRYDDSEKAESTLSFGNKSGTIVVEDDLPDTFVTGVKGNNETTYRTGNVNITKSQIGLGAVANQGQAVKAIQDSSLNLTSGGAYTELQKKVDKTTTVNGQELSGNVTITKSDIELGDVVNTGDSATPVSGGTTKFTTGGAYTELNKKVNKTTTVNGHALSSNVTVTKSDVSLGSVANYGQTATPTSGSNLYFTAGGAYTELAKKQNTLAQTNGTGTLNTSYYRSTDGSRTPGVSWHRFGPVILVEYDVTANSNVPAGTNVISDIPFTPISGGFCQPNSNLASGDFILQIGPYGPSSHLIAFVPINSVPSGTRLAGSFVFFTSSYNNELSETTSTLPRTKKEALQLAEGKPIKKKGKK